MSTHLGKPLISLTIAEVLFNLSGYVIHAVAGRVLGPADYGRYGLVVTLTTTVIILIGNGVPTAMSRFLSEVFERSPEQVRAIKRAGIVLQTTLIGAVTLVFFLLAPVVSRLLGDPSLTPLFRLSSLIIPAFAASSFYFYYFTGIHRFHTQAILKMARAALRIAITVPLVIALKLPGAILGYILVPALTFLLGIFFDRKYSGAFPKDPTAVFSKQNLLKAAWPITLFLVFYEVFISIDLYLVKALLASDAETGYYNAALTLGRIPFYLFYALSIILLPALAKLKSDGDPEKTTRLLTNSLRYAGIILVPVSVLLFSYAEPLSVLFFGNAYRAAAPSLQILSFGLSFLTVFYLVATGLMGLGHASLAMWLSIGGTAMTAFLNALAIPRFGILGAAWATAASSVIITLITLILLQRVIRIPYHPRNMIVVAISGIVLALSATFLPATPDLFLVPSTLLGILFFVALFALGILGKRDLEPFHALFVQKNKTG